MGCDAAICQRRYTATMERARKNNKLDDNENPDRDSPRFLGQLAANATRAISKKSPGVWGLFLTHYERSPRENVLGGRGTTWGAPA